MGKVARVVFNRLERGMPLGMDSTINYALGRSTLEPARRHQGRRPLQLVPARDGLGRAPHRQPRRRGDECRDQSDPGDWLYFVTVEPGDTRFTADYRRAPAQRRESTASRRALEEAQASDRARASRGDGA